MNILTSASYSYIRAIFVFGKAQFKWLERIENDLRELKAKRRVQKENSREELARRQSRPRFLEDRRPED
jgi:hypothetical protein